MPNPTQNQEKVNCEGHTPVPSSTGVLPRGLIGPKCSATVTIEGSHSNSLLDTGLQVTTVSKSFYESHLSHQPILPLNDLLDIEGAGGQEVPYLGYIEVSILSPENITGEPEEVNTLVLIVPNCGTNMEIPVLTGTNTLDILYEKCISHQDKHARNKTGWSLLTSREPSIYQTQNPSTKWQSWKSETAEQKVHHRLSRGKGGLDRICKECPNSFR